MNMKRILAFCLTLTLLFGMLPMGTAAEETQPATTAATTAPTETTGETANDNTDTDGETGSGLLAGLMTLLTGDEDEETENSTDATGNAGSTGSTESNETTGNAGSTGSTESNETTGNTESTGSTDSNDTTGGGDSAANTTAEGGADTAEPCAVCGQTEGHSADCENNPAPINTDSTKPVWLYLPNETEPYATYDTILAAVSYVNGTYKKDNCIIELHGDTVETKTIQPLYSMTIRSEAGADHTASFPAVTNYGIRLNPESNRRVLTLGGGQGYGTLTLDLCNAIYGVYVNNGTVIIQDGLTIRNATNTTAEGGAVRMVSSTNKPVLKINGGTFENNTAASGGAIAVMTGVAYINGGTFTGNSATNVGNTIYCNQGTDVHIQGKPVFGENQDIYITNNNATDDNALIKDGPITSAKIPVTLGNGTTNLYELRNVLVSGAAEVTEADLSVFTITNTADLAVMYRRLAFTGADSATGKPVLELVPDFLNNFDNFIDDEFTPAPFGDTQGKTAKWLNDDKSQAEIIIDESSTEKDVLIIGSICYAHGLTSECMKNVLNTAAKYNNVDYYFSSQTSGGPSQFSQKIAGEVRGPVSGTLAKGKTTSREFDLYSGAHDFTGQIATALAAKLQEKQYNQIILIFDNCSVSVMSYDALTIKEQKACYQAANLLAPYYESGRIAWVSSGQHVMYRDFENQTTYTSDDDFTIDSLLMRGSYSTDTSLYHYDTGHVTNNESSYGKYDKFNTFFYMALFDPVTWLKGIEKNRIPEWSEYTINESGVLYNNVNDVENYIGSKFIRDEIVIKDEVDPALPINSVYMERSEDNGATWKDISNENNVTITREGQKVTASISGIGAEDTKLRLRIVCDCPGEFKIGADQPKDTNIGYAEVIYKAGGEEKITYDLVSPELLKWFPPAYIVFEENGGSTVSDMEGVSYQKIGNRTMPFTSKPGFEFKGWYASADFAGGRVTELPEAFPPGTTTYYARWIDVTGELLTDKSADEQGDGTYKITLESYATGQTILTQNMVVKPTDISLVLDYSDSMTYCLDANCKNTFLPQNEDGDNRLYNVRYNGTSDEMFMIHTDHQTNDYISVEMVKANMGTVTEYYARFKELDTSGNRLGGVYRKVYYCAECSEKAVAANGVNADRGRWHWEKNPSDHSYQVVPFTTYNGGPTENGLDYCPFFDLSIKEHACRTRHQMQYEALKTFMAAIVDSANTQNVDHRLSIVRFATTTNTTLSMTSVLGADGKLNSAIAAALEDYNFALGTATGYGLENGVSQFTNDDTRSRLLVLLTDGVPTSVDTNIPKSLAATYRAIHDFDAKVYTIGIFKGADASNKGTITAYNASDFGSDLSTEKQIGAANSFMKLLSSNYPDISKVSEWSTATLDPELPEDKTYYLAAKDAGELKNVFTLIAGDISSTTSTISLGKSTVVRDIVTRYFDVIPDSYITAYTMTYGGKNANNEEIWTEEADDTASRSTLKIESGATSSGNLTITMPSSTTVEVTNFDFGENYVGMDKDVDDTETPHGKKLVIELLVRPKDGFLGGNNVPTNADSSGIYDKDDELQEEFPVPDVDVPIPDLTVNAPDKNVYLMGDLSEEQLKAGMTATYGLGTYGAAFDIDLAIGAPGYGVEDWMREFVTISHDCNGPFTDLMEDGTYQGSVTVTPMTEGKVQAKTATGTGNIYVYKPTLTYKDTNVYYGGDVPASYAPNWETTKTVWKHDDTLSTDVTMIGTAPTLTPVYNLVNTSDVEDGKINTKNDIPVKVTSVKIDNTEVLSYTSFAHTDCEENEDLKGGRFLLHPQTCTLTITKVGGDAGDPYSFTIKKDGVKYSEATITAGENGSGSVEIYELPVGTYTIEEHTNWSWRFTPTYSADVVLTESNTAGTITCTNSRIPEKYQWFNGYSDVVPNTYGQPNT